MSRRTAGPSTALRSGRDDKVEGGGPPLAFVEVDGQNQRNSNQPNSHLPSCSSTRSVRYGFQEAVFPLIWTALILSRPYGTDRDLLDS
jgi:hypothetical protein